MLFYDFENHCIIKKSLDEVLVFILTQKAILSACFSSIIIISFCVRFICQTFWTLPSIDLDFKNVIFTGID